MSHSTPIPADSAAHIEAALWALKSGNPEAAEKYLLAYVDEDGNHVSIALTADTTEVEVN